MAKSFSAEVEAWVRKTDATLTDVFREASRGVADEVALPKDEGGPMPVVTGNLRNSLAASTASMPSVRWRRRIKGATNDFAPNQGEIEAVIGAAEIGQTVFLGFRAPYAQKVERVNGFVRLTAQRWKQIVDEAVRTVKGWTGA
jgi:hypothetical protein